MTTIELELNPSMRSLHILLTSLAALSASALQGDYHEQRRDLVERLKLRRLRRPDGNIVSSTGKKLRKLPKGVKPDTRDRRTLQGSMPDCENDDDCPSSDEYCIDALCQQVDCKRDNQCPNNDCCINDFCDSSCACKNDKECSKDDCCIDDECKSCDCRDHDDCDDDEWCDDDGDCQDINYDVKIVAVGLDPASIKSLDDCDYELEEAFVGISDWSTSDKDDLATRLTWVAPSSLPVCGHDEYHNEVERVAADGGDGLRKLKKKRSKSSRSRGGSSDDYDEIIVVGAGVNTRAVDVDDCSDEFEKCAKRMEKNWKTEDLDDVDGEYIYVGKGDCHEKELERLYKDQI